MPDRFAEPLDAARSLRSVILENRGETESGRRIAAPIIDGLLASRLGRLALGKEYAGLEVPPADALPVFETLAEAEASVAWIVWNSSLPCWFSRFLTDDVRAEVFGDPEDLYASSTRPTGKAVRIGDSYCVNGRWSLVSGCMHASWIPVMCMVEVDGKVEMLAPDVPHMRLVFVPRDAHEILDTWYVGGLRGTGSHDCVLSDVSVPAVRTFAMGDPSLMESPFGRMPIVCTMSAGCAAICIGIAKGALQALVDLADDKASVGGGPGLRERPAVQSLIAGAETRLSSVRDRVEVTTNALWDAVVRGNEIEPTDIGNVFSAAIIAAQECRRLVTDVYAAAGTSALYTDNPIERGHRDIHAAMQHVVLQPFWLEQVGRVRLGLDATQPLFSV